MPQHKLAEIKEELGIEQAKDRKTHLELLNAEQYDKEFIEVSQRLASRKIQIDALKPTNQY